MKYKLLTALLFVSLFSYAQNDVVIKHLSSKPFIEVTGTASKEVVPDKIFMSITLTNKIIDKQQFNIQTQEEKLKKILAKNNIDMSLLSLSDANSDILTRKNKDVGYEVKKVFTLQLATADQVSKIAKELQDLNIKETSIIKLEHSDIDNLRKEVRIAAIKAAKAKAEYLLAAIGEQLDKPLEVREVVDRPFFSSILSNNSSIFPENATQPERKPHRWALRRSGSTFLILLNTRSNKVAGVIIAYLGSPYRHDFYSFYRKLNTMSNNSVTLHKVLKTTPEKLFRAFTDADAYASWLPPYGFTAYVDHMEVKPGGTYRMSFTNFTTGNKQSFGGTYVEVDPDKLIKYMDKFDDPNLPGEMTTTIWMKKVSAGTDLTITQENIPEMIPADMCYLGWQDSLDKLTRLVEPEIADE